jgi:hypothetical protein
VLRLERKFRAVINLSSSGDSKPIQMVFWARISIFEALPALKSRAIVASPFGTETFKNWMRKKRGIMSLTNNDARKRRRYPGRDGAPASSAPRSAAQREVLSAVGTIYSARYYAGGDGASAPSLPLFVKDIIPKK